MSTTNALAPMNWEMLPGAAVQIASSFESIWALNSANSLFQCKLPCDQVTNNWAIIPESNFKWFSVNPFEVWAVSTDSSLYRCKFPCKTLQDFQLVTQGVSKVALGLDRVWIISNDFRVGRTLLNFEFLGRFMDVRVLNWKQLYGNIGDLSVGEDSEVWGIREDDRQLLRYHRPTRQWLQVSDIKAKGVSVGSDFIYLVDQDNNALRCSRPCWQVKFTPIGKKMRYISAEMSGPGVLYGSLNIDPKMANLVVGFTIGNRTGLHHHLNHLNTSYIPYQANEWARLQLPQQQNQIAFQ